MRLIRRWLLPTALALAAVAGGIAWYQQPTFRQARLNQRLIAAVHARDEAAVTEALADGADPNARVYQEEEPSLRTLLIAFFQPKTAQNTSPVWWPVLTVAAEAGDLQIVQALLNKGANVNGKGCVGNNMALAMVTLGERPGMTRPDVTALLLKHGADADARNVALHYAISSDDLPSAALLLDSGANTNDDRYGFTPLTEAIRGNELAMIKMLLAHGANPNSKGKYFSKSALAFAEQFRQRIDPRIIPLLKAAGAKT